MIAALPNKKLEDLSNHDSEDAAGEQLMAQVRFESSMFAVQKKFSEPIMKEVLSATRGQDVPKELAATKELRELVDKLKLCGILDEEPPPAPASKPSTPARVVPPKERPGAPARVVPPEDNSPKHTSVTEGGQTSSFIALGAIAISLGAVALLLWRRRK